MTGVVHVASVGRSLGVHLILATQRPAGAVSADIQANVNLRVALRMRDRADSVDVIDAPDAASVSAHRPGRGFARTGGGDLVPFQAAHVSAAAQWPDGEPLRLRLAAAAAPDPAGGAVAPTTTTPTWPGSSPPCAGPPTAASTRPTAHGSRRCPGAWPRAPSGAARHRTPSRSPADVAYPSAWSTFPVLSDRSRCGGARPAVTGS